MDRRQSSRELVEKRVAQGRGQGVGANYVPWLYVREVSGRGTCMRTRGWTTNREHHLLGSAQTSYFYILEWASAVVDIREEYPLLPLDGTLAIARQLGVRHPTHKRNTPGGVITADFLVTMMKEGFEHQEAHIVASTELLEDKEKEPYRRILEIKKRYFLARKIPVIVRTEADIPEDMVDNIRNIHKHRDISNRVRLSSDELARVAQALTTEALTGMPLRDAGKACDKRFGLNPGHSLAVAYHLIATKQWKVDMHVRIEPYRPVSFISEPTLRGA